MGGDNAPREPVKGACSYALNNQDDTLILVGRQREISSILSERGGKTPENIEIYHAEEIVAMNESPVSAVKGKKDSSIARAVSLVKEGKAEAVISAGNTGVVVAQTTLGLKRLKGVKRPGIIVPMLGEKGIFYFIDAGANSESKAEFLYQHAVIGAVYCKYLLKKEKPVVGLLNIGTEEVKGSELVKEAHKLIGSIEDPFFEYRGFIEGTDVFKGECDLMVCEGFVGNVVLKLSEGLAKSLVSLFKQEVTKNPLRLFGAFLLKGAMKDLRHKIDYEEYEGALLIGVNGVCTILHGASTAAAFENGLKGTARLCNIGINEQIIKYATLLKREDRH